MNNQLSNDEMLRIMEQVKQTMEKIIKYERTQYVVSKPKKNSVN